MAESLHDITIDLGGTTMDRVVEKIAYVTERHHLGEGAYCRWLWDSAKGGRNLAAHILSAACRAVESRTRPLKKCAVSA